MPYSDEYKAGYNAGYHDGYCDADGGVYWEEGDLKEPPEPENDKKPTLA